MAVTDSGILGPDGLVRSRWWRDGSFGFRPYRWGQWQPVIPSLYWEAIGPEQQIHDLFAYVASLVDYSNNQTEWLEALHATLDEIEANQPGLIDAATKAEIERLVESGEMKEIIKGAINELVLINEHAFANRMGMMPYKPTGSYNTMQGGCLIGDSIIFQIGNNSDNDNLLQRISRETGIVLNEAVAQVGHGNSATYNAKAGQIFISGYNPSGNSQAVGIFDAVTLEKVADATVDTTENIYALTYCETLDCYYAINNVSNSSIASGQAKMLRLAFDSSSGVFTVTKEKVITSQVPIYVFGVQCVGDYLVMFTSGQDVLPVYTLDMEPLKTVNLNRDVDFYQRIIEIEWLDGTSLDDIVLGFTCGTTNTVGHGTFAYAQTSLINSQYHMPVGIANQYIASQITVWVDGTNTAWDRDGTPNNPFQTIYEALNCAYNESFTHLMVETRNTVIQGSSSMPIYLIGANDVTIHANDDTLQPTGVALIACSNITIIRATVKAPNLSTNAGADVFLRRASGILMQDVTPETTDSAAFNIYYDSDLLIRCTTPVDMSGSVVNGSLSFDGGSITYDLAADDNKILHYSDAQMGIKAYDASSTVVTISGALPWTTSAIKFVVGLRSTTGAATARLVIPIAFESGQANATAAAQAWTNGGTFIGTVRVTANRASNHINFTLDALPADACYITRAFVVVS